MIGSKHTHDGRPAGLLEAIKRCDEKETHQLLDLGKDFDLERQGHRCDGTALYWASCRGWLDVVGLLLALGADVSSQTMWGGTPLHAAADNNQLNVARLLLRWGANPNHQTSQGDTPCHLAAFRGHVKMVILLVEGGADVTITNRRRNDVMREALSRNHCNILHEIWKLKEHNLEKLGLRQTTARSGDLDPRRKASSVSGFSSLQEQEKETSDTIGLLRTDDNHLSSLSDDRTLGRSVLRRQHTFPGHS